MPRHWGELAVTEARTLPVLPNPSIKGPEHLGGVATSKRHGPPRSGATTCTLPRRWGRSTQGFTSQITSRLPWLIVAVVAISFLLLTTAFRSVVIATKAAILNILSIGAVYGVIVAIFEWGWGKSLIGL